MIRSPGAYGARLGHARRRRPELALTHLSKSVELNPSFALGYAGLGYALASAANLDADWNLGEAHRLSPRDPFLAIYSPTVRYMALFALGRYEETIAVCRATAALHPNQAGAWRPTFTIGPVALHQERHQ